MPVIAPRPLNLCLLPASLSVARSLLLCLLLAPCLSVCCSLPTSLSDTRTRCLSACLAVLSRHIGAPVCRCRSHRTSLTSSRRNSICKTPMRMDSFLKRKVVRLHPSALLQLIRRRVCWQNATHSHSLHSLRRHLCWQIPLPPHSSHSLCSCRCCLIGALRLWLTVSGLLRHQLGREPTVKEVLNRAPLQPHGHAMYHHQYVTQHAAHGVSWAQSHIYSCALDN